MRPGGQMNVERSLFPGSDCAWNHTEVRAERRVVARLEQIERRDICARTGGSYQPVLGKFPAGDLLRSAFQVAGVGVLSFRGRGNHPASESAGATSACESR